MLIKNNAILDFPFLNGFWRQCRLKRKIDAVQKMKFSIKDFFSKCDQIRRKLRIWSHLLKKP